MGKLVKLKLDKEINREEFLDFLNFHQFRYETEEDEVFNFNTMLNEKEVNFLISEDKIEEFKVMILIYKDLQASRKDRNLNIPIENSAIDYEKTRRINVVELKKEDFEEKEEPVFIKKEVAGGDSLSMEDSFYGNKSKKKEKRIAKAYLENEALEEEEVKVESKRARLIKDILKIILLIIVIVLLLGIFLLIR